MWRLCVAIVVLLCLCVNSALLPYGRDAGDSFLANISTPVDVNLIIQLPIGSDLFDSVRFYDNGSMFLVSTASKSYLFVE